MSRAGRGSCEVGAGTGGELVSGDEITEAADSGDDGHTRQERNYHTHTRTHNLSNNQFGLETRKLLPLRAKET